MSGLLTVFSKAYWAALMAEHVCLRGSGLGLLMPIMFLQPVFAQEGIAENSPGRDAGEIGQQLIKAGWDEDGIENRDSQWQEGCLVLPGIFTAGNKLAVSSALAERVSTVYFSEGQKFTDGDVLLELDCSLLNSEIEQARLKYEFAKLGYRRRLQASELSGEESELENLQVQLVLAELNLLRQRAQECQIRAPFDGTVLEVSVQKQQRVAVHEVLMLLAEDLSMRFHFLVSPSWLTWLAEGSVFDIRTEAGTVQAAFSGHGHEVISDNQMLPAVAVVSSGTDANIVLFPDMVGRACILEAGALAKEQTLSDSSGGHLP